MYEDLFQWAGLVVTLIGSGIAWGKLKQKVDGIKEDQEKTSEAFLRKEAFQPFMDEILRRLKRIEEKQDSFNGRPKG